MSKKGKEAFLAYQTRKTELKQIIRDRQNKPFNSHEELATLLIQTVELTELPEIRPDFLNFISPH